RRVELDVLDLRRAHTGLGCGRVPDETSGARQASVPVGTWVGWNGQLVAAVHLMTENASGTRHREPSRRVCPLAGRAVRVAIARAADTATFGDTRAPAAPTQV